MINVYVSGLTPRIEYSFKLIFETILNNKVNFIDDETVFKNTQGVRLNYSKNSELGGFYIEPFGLLHESHLQYQHPEISKWENVHVFYHVENSKLPFDLFSAAFYLVSRYEEYLPGKRDRHQRFMARKSLAGVNQFIEKPLVNIWALLLADSIEKENPGFKFERSKFTYQPTIDIDNAWAFRNKGLPRITLSLIKDILHGRWRTMVQRLSVVFRLSNDPYDNYDFMLSIFKQYNLRPIYFFLLNKNGRHDRSLSHRNLYFRNLIQKLAKSGEVGIHPSYASNEHHRLLQVETNRLKSIIRKEVELSRQHYLKLSMPKTYRRLIDNGIKADFTMGFPSRPGFRASIATPYPFFDILENRTTGLIIYPFQVMDVTLLHYRNLNANDALKKIQNLMEETAKVGGTFISLWHNESMSDTGHWKGWRNVYTEMTRKAAELNDDTKNKTTT